MSLDEESKVSYEYFKNIGHEEGHEERMKQIAVDKAERDAEVEGDILIYEREGLSEEDKIKIIKLDETNNESYAYLRKHGNAWQYNPADVHFKLKRRLYRRFDTFDKSNDNIITIKEVLLWADRMKEMCKSTDEEIETVRSALRTFFTAVGVNETGLTRENWVEGNQVFGEAEKLRKELGEKTLVALLGNSYFDVLDTDETGTVSLPELKRMMQVFEVPQEAAYPFFQKADTNKCGKLQREEMHVLFSKFWLEKYNSEYDAIYAYKY